MNQKKNAKISNNVIRRLPRYYRYLSELLKKGVVRVSSSELGSRMELTASQIRQDLSCFGEFGQQGYGYNVEALKHEIAHLLGITKKSKAVIVGVGNLGHALIKNFSFSNFGFDLKAAFDITPDLVGTNIDGIEIFHVDLLADYIQSNAIDIAVVMVPKNSVKDIVSTLVRAGIRGIWNFTNTEIHIPVHIYNRNVPVENVFFADSLLTLGYHLKEDNN